MPNANRNELARTLADLDQILAESEEIANDPQDECQQSARDFLAEFQEVRRAVEAKLRGE